MFVKILIQPMYVSTEFSCNISDQTLSLSLSNLLCKNSLDCEGRVGGEQCADLRSGGCGGHGGS